MNSPDFQLAFATLIASPQLCKQAIDDEPSVFDQFALTEKEKARLRSVVRQKGMSICCSLYRMNRITPLYTQLTQTATLLGDELITLAEEFWESYPDSSLQFKEEVLAFGQFLLAKLETGLLKFPYLQEILRLELAMNELSYAPDIIEKTVHFDHNIVAILLAMDRGTLQTEKLPKVQVAYKVYLEEQTLKLALL
jgi:hypothetical protein